MTDYPAGTVAKATVRGVPDVTVLRIQNDNADFVWVGGVRVGGNVGYFDEDVTDVRPLVVLDLDAEALRVLRKALLRWRKWTSLVEEGEAVGQLLDQIEAQTKPPRIPEPGLWGVVSEPHGRQFVRDSATRKRPWLDCGSPSGNHVMWDEIDDPVLIRPGIEDAQ